MDKPAQTVLSYIRQNVTLPGENFINQYGKLTVQDKADISAYAIAEMAILGIPVK